MWHALCFVALKMQKVAQAVEERNLLSSKNPDDAVMPVIYHGIAIGISHIETEPLGPDTSGAF
jgi:hypothetical protein